MAERVSKERLLHYVDVAIDRAIKVQGYQPSTLQIKGYLLDTVNIKASSSDIAKCAEIVYRDREREKNS